MSCPSHCEFTLAQFPQPWQTVAALFVMQDKIGLHASNGPTRARGVARMLRRVHIVIPGRCEASNYDVQLHIGESRDSPMRNCASEVWSFGPSRNDEAWLLRFARNDGSTVETSLALCL